MEKVLLNVTLSIFIGLYILSPICLLILGIINSIPWMWIFSTLWLISEILILIIWLRLIIKKYIEKGGE